ncbi:MAG TPA: glycosyltransferase family 39 protein [Longilinea sp.]|nr:glycosyltransferase family 39 protein [Longilinea sp.]
MPKRSDSNRPIEDPRPTAIQIKLGMGETAHLSVDVHAQDIPSSSPLTPPVKQLSRRSLHWKKWQMPELPAWAKRIQPQIIWAFWIMLAVYLITRVIGLEQYPIFFYSDEAVTSVRSMDLISNGLRDVYDRFLPTFFINDNKYSLGLTVYLVTIPRMIFGNHIWLSRGLTILIGLAAMIWVYRLLQDGYKLKYGWLGGLVLLAVPAWFLFSRLALETPVMTAFYAGFLYYYLRYRQEDPKNIYKAFLLGAAAFYSYFPGQMVMVASGVFLFMSDFRYHWQQRKKLWPAVVMLVVLTLPLIRFMLTVPGEYTHRLVQYGSYLASSQPFMDKLMTYLGNYLYALSPLYWFNPIAPNPIWWVMRGYSQLPWLLSPFWAWGMVQAFRKWRDPAMRMVIAAWIAGPSAASLMSIEITRVLSMIIPGVIFTAIGLDHAIRWCETRWKPARWGVVLVAIGCLAASPLMLVDALHNGPTWYTNYGQSGMQWGSRQVFAAALEYHAQEPDTPVYISGSWTWQSDMEMRFFIPDGSNIRMQNADAFIDNYDPTVNTIRFILLASDYQRAVDSGRFCDIENEDVILYPDGTPGFYVVRLDYCPGVEQVFEEEHAARLVLTAEEALVEGISVEVEHSSLSDGNISNLFDGDINTYIRTEQLNPLVIVIHYPTAETLSGFSVNVGSEPIHIVASVIDENGTQTTHTLDTDAADNRRDVVLTFPHPLQVVELHVEVTLVGLAEISSVHCWDMTLLH